jgi:hypothetical protein
MPKERNLSQRNKKPEAGRQAAKNAGRKYPLSEVIAKAQNLE